MMDLSLLKVSVSVNASCVSSMAPSSGRIVEVQQLMNKSQSVEDQLICLQHE